MSKVRPTVNSEHSAERRAVLRLMESNPSASFLDVGCGDGSFTLEMGKKIGTGSVKAVEVEPRCVSMAREKGLAVSVANLDEPLPFPDGAFDVVSAISVIECLDDTDNFVKALCRVTAKSGYAIVTTPNLAALHSIFSLMLGFQPFHASVSAETRLGNPLIPRSSRGYGYLSNANRRVFTYAGLKALFEYHGFRVDKIVGAGYSPAPSLLSGPLARIDPRHAVHLVLKARRV